MAERAEKVTKLAAVRIEATLAGLVLARTRVELASARFHARVLPRLVLRAKISFRGAQIRWLREFPRAEVDALAARAERATVKAQAAALALERARFAVFAGV